MNLLSISESHPAPALQHVVDLTVYLATPVEAGNVIGLSGQGKRRIIPITSGSMSGRLYGKVLPGGADFQMVISDTTAKLDARYIVQLDSGEHIYIHNRGIRRGSADNIAKLMQGAPVAPEAIYFRSVPSFEVSSPKLEWLTHHVFVASGTRHLNRVELSIFQVM